MAVYLSSDITVGNFRWTGVCNVKITKSIRSSRDTALISLPSHVTVSKEGTSNLSFNQTAKLFKAGDNVVIKLGYDDNLHEEFRGFVNIMNLKHPFELECEGYSYQLRRTIKDSQNHKTIKLKALLQKILTGTEVVIHEDTPDADLTMVVIKDLNAYETLDMLCQKNAYVAYFINGNQLYVGSKDEAQKELHTQYWLGWNTVQEEQLKYRDKSNTKVLLSITYKDEKGKTHHFTDGEKGGQPISYAFGRVTKEEALRLMKQKAGTHVYEGYEGKIKTFLQPYVAPGWKARIEEAENGAHAGDYIIESVTVEFGNGGAWRTLEISKKISE